MGLFRGALGCLGVSWAWTSTLCSFAAARAFVAETRLANVEILEADAYASPLPAGSFDLTHVRFLFAPVGRDAQLMNELWRLTKPGGIIAIQEPDSAAWRCYPPSDAWDRLKAAILEAFRRGGGDFDAGRRTYMMLRDRGAEDLRVRAAIVALAPVHPYLRLVGLVLLGAISHRAAFKCAGRKGWPSGLGRT